ncbi:MAG: class I SAM-dependent methyltransferase [Lactobacillus sp.]|nr:class I SAM-dependent methyltransferase [Lactobacillus sp.]
MKNLEEKFQAMLSCVNLLKENLNISQIEALTETFDNLETGKIKVEEGAPDEATVQQLSAAYQALNYEDWSGKLKGEVFTYLSLKAISDDGLDANSMPTPIIISTVIAMMMDKMLPKQEMKLLDPAIGSGSLVYSVVEQLKQSNHSKNFFQIAGIDHNEDLLSLADVGAHVRHNEVELAHQDAILPWILDQPDVVVSDLPIGYYPLDDNVKNFDLRANEGHSFAHFVYLEQIVKNLKENGWGFLIVPKSMLTGPAASEVMSWMTKKVYLRAIVELPDKLFKQQAFAKSILVFQNHGQNSQASEVLLSKLTQLDETALFRFNESLDKWYTKFNKR